MEKADYQQANTGGDQRYNLKLLKIYPFCQ